MHTESVRRIAPFFWGGGRVKSAALTSTQLQTVANVFPLINTKISLVHILTLTPKSPYKLY